MVASKVARVGTIADSEPENHGKISISDGNENSLIRDLYQFVKGKTNVRVTVPDTSPLPVSHPLIDTLYAKWSHGMHQTEIERMTSSDSDRYRFARMMLDRLSIVTGSAKSLELYRNKPHEATHEVFNPATFSFEDLYSGIRFKKNGAIPNVTPQTTVGEIKGLLKARQLRLKAALEGLFNFESDSTTLADVVLHIQSIPVRYDDPSGYELNLRGLNDEILLDDDAVIYLRNLASLEDSHKNNLGNGLQICDPAFLEVAKSVLERQTMSRSGLNIERFRFLSGGLTVLGTGLTGEISNHFVRSFFEMGASVYMPGTSLSSSKLSAALVLRKIQLAKNTQEVRGGKLIVDAANVFNPGDTVARMKAVLGDNPGAKALLVGMAYTTSGGGAELLTEIAQHALFEELLHTTDKNILGAMRLLSPTRAGKLIDSNDRNGKSDTAYFQGPSYNLAQLIKVMSTDVLQQDVGDEVSIYTPTSFISGTDGLMNRLVTQVLPFAEQEGVFPARNPDTTGSFMSLAAIGAYILRNLSFDPRHRPHNFGPNFDGGVAMGKPIQSSLARAFARSKIPFRKKGSHIAGFRAMSPLPRFLTGIPKALGPFSRVGKK